MTGLTTCLQCQPGYYCLGGSISPVPCPAGMYAAHYGSPNAACDAPCACPIGRYCPAGSTSPTLGSTNCLACPIGSYCSGGGAPAVACPAGRYGSAPSLASIGCSGTCNATGGNWCGPAQMASPARCLPRSSARLGSGALMVPSFCAPAAPTTRRCRRVRCPTARCAPQTLTRVR
jgi:hypothetical protein